MKFLWLVLLGMTQVGRGQDFENLGVGSFFYAHDDVWIQCSVEHGCECRGVVGDCPHNWDRSKRAHIHEDLSLTWEPNNIQDRPPEVYQFNGQIVEPGDCYKVTKSYQLEKVPCPDDSVTWRTALDSDLARRNSYGFWGDEEESAPEPPKVTFSVTPPQQVTYATLFPQAMWTLGPVYLPRGWSAMCLYVDGQKKVLRPNWENPQCQKPKP